MPKKIRFTNGGVSYPDLEYKQIKDFTRFSMGFTPSTRIPEHWSGENEWLSIAGLNSGKYLRSGNKKVSDDAVKNKHPFTPGTVLMSFKLSIGKTVITQVPVFTNEAICGFENNDNFYNEYLYYALSSMDITKFGIPAVKGITLNSNSIANIEIPFPALPEQEKIAGFLSALDESILVETQALELFREQKKGYLQNLFSQELRFRDDNGRMFPDWEEKKLGEVADIRGGGTPDSNNAHYWNGEYNWFTPSEVGKSKYVSSSKRRITKEGLVKSSAKEFPSGTVLLTSRASLGEMAILTEKAATNQGFQNLVVKDNLITNQFLYYCQGVIQKYIYRTASGSTFLEISGKQLSKCPIPTPSLTEQQKIADFLSALDDRIELQQEKVLLLKEQKRGYLQGIFG